MIIIGDLHQKNEKTQKYIEYLFNWVERTFDIKNEILVLLGDVVDKSLMPSFNLDFFFILLKRFKQVIILKGNHDESKNYGFYLKPLRHQKNIILVTEPKEIQIEGMSCLFLPYKKDMSEYEELEGSYDYIFTHAYFKENNFNDEGIDLSKLNGIKIAGHDHQHKIILKDKIVMGTPYPTKFLEHLYAERKIMQINNSNDYKLIDVPKIFTYFEVEYNENGKVECKYPFFKLYIKNAPSDRLAKKVYKNYDIYKVSVKSDIYVDESGSEVKENDFDKKISFTHHLDNFLKLNPKCKGVVNILKKLFHNC